ncbi:TetR/AcrR family transcriptional regulator [Modestobacter sp. VKM Ac-2985]|uniref:TetR/AcrR family transcriptional regulator n=1 Tax=Modestobacter sp. VKM Ac-2985 TaxID=3004139 RepID=UPI0022AB82AC|nr:TetR family transcriptional regulator [Modestobacter sp. VKM Ac-2985]MCZ2840143.1 TetR family transcriptional regulator [Modestobacter sp. VKM Ac-2985]
MAARRSGTLVRTAIRTAAGELFRERGYARTSVRDIAAQAHVDPAVVIRQFGTKELLFLETVHLSIDDEPLLDVPVEQLGQRFIDLLLEADRPTRGVFLALVRGSTEPEIAARLAASHEAAFVAPLRARLSGPDADLRARLAASLVGGLLYALWVVGDDRLAAADRQDVVHRYGALLQELLTPQR